MPLVEAPANVAVGYGVAVLTQIVVFPLFGLQASLTQDLGMGAVFTFVSILRSYLLRRAFEALRAVGGQISWLACRSQPRTRELSHLLGADAWTLDYVLGTNKVFPLGVKGAEHERGPDSGAPGDAAQVDCVVRGERRRSSPTGDCTEPRLQNGWFPPRTAQGAALAVCSRGRPREARGASCRAWRKASPKRDKKRWLVRLAQPTAGGSALSA